MKVSTLVTGWLWAIIPGGSGGALLPAARPPRRRAPQVWAIVVGIDDYTDPRIPDSETAADNALRVLQLVPGGRLGGRPPAPDGRLRQRRPGHAATPPPRTSCPPGTT